MPVTTRNQDKKASVSKLQVPVINKPEKVRLYYAEPSSYTVNELRVWFISLMSKRLSEVEKNQAKKLELKKLIQSNLVSSFFKPALENKHRTLHFDNIRDVTEVMFFVDKYLPEVYNLSPRMEKLTKSVYKKVQDLYQQIRDNIIKPETDDEHKSVDALIYTLQDVEKTVIPLLPSDQQLKRRRKFVCYTGMDTIEPENEYDGITDIWFDLTKSEDPDYDPTEDKRYVVYEEDDEGEYKYASNLIDDCHFDKYVVYDEDDEDEYEDEDNLIDEHDYSEDEDYVPEDSEEDKKDIYEEEEIFEIMVNSKKKYQEKEKLMSSSIEKKKHIRFEDDE